MGITPPNSLEAPVGRKIEETHHGTQEVVANKRARLTAARERGYQDVAAGRVIQLDGDDQIDALFANL